MTEEGTTLEATDPVGSGAASADPYEPPALRRLGTLAELTRGGTAGPADAFGGAGSSGVIP